MKARRPWTGCPRNKSGASRSRLPRRRRSGAIIASTSSIRPGTWTSRSRSSGASASSMARSSCSMAWPASSRSPRRSGARPTATACPRFCFINKLDRTGADFWRGVASIKERLGANAVPIQIPIGREDQFKGVIDLVEMKAIYYRDDLGNQIDVVDIPDDLRAEADEAPPHDDRGRRRDGRRADAQVPRGRGADDPRDQARPAPRHAHDPDHPGPDRLGAQEQGRPEDARRGRRLPAVAARRPADDRPRPQDRRRGHPDPERRGAVQRPRLQDRGGPVRRQAGLLPGLLGHAQGRLVRHEPDQGQEGAHRAHPPDARQPPRGDRAGLRRRHRGRRRAQGHLHRRHPDRPRASRSSSSR